MLPITNLYLKNHVLYDYHVFGSKRLSYRVNNGKPFIVHHSDGSSSVAWGYGEKRYTYDPEELRIVRASDAARHAYMAERKDLLEKLGAMTNEQLKALLATVE